MSQDDAQSIRDRIAALRDQINDHNRAYYEHDAPQVPDSTYDALFRELKQLEADYPEFAATDSPTQRVGVELSNNLNKLEHVTPMLSLDNAMHADEFEDFDTRLKKLLPGKAITYACEPKLDGLAVSISYRDGQLMRALTRGNGRQGEDVTANIKAIASIPQTLKGKTPQTLKCAVKCVWQVSFRKT